MTERPNIALMSEVQKEALIMALWEELEQIKQENAQLKQQHAQDQSRLEQLKQLEQQQNQPKKNSHNSSVPPSRDQKVNKPAPDQTRQRRTASLGHKGEACIRNRINMSCPWPRCVPIVKRLLSKKSSTSRPAMTRSKSRRCVLW